MHDGRSRVRATARGWARGLWTLALLAAAIPAGATDAPLPFYAVIFHVERAPGGLITRFDVESVIDPRVGPDAKVSVAIPDTFIIAARTALEARWRADPRLSENADAHYTYAFFDPSEPTRGDIGQDGGGVRFPFVLRLRLDPAHVQELHMHATPYVQDGVAMLLAGDTMGVRIERDAFVYERDPDRADVVFKFWQASDGDTPAEMRLLVANHTAHRVALLARMTVPGATDVRETDVLAIEPAAVGRERWPHAIAQLNLALDAGNAHPPRP